MVDDLEPPTRPCRGSTRNVTGGPAYSSALVTNSVTTSSASPTRPAARPFSTAAANRRARGTASGSTPSCSSRCGASPCTGHSPPEAVGALAPYARHVRLATIVHCQALDAPEACRNRQSPAPPERVTLLGFVDLFTRQWVTVGRSPSPPGGGDPPDRLDSGWTAVGQRVRARNRSEHDVRGTVGRPSDRSTRGPVFRDRPCDRRGAQSGRYLFARRCRGADRGPPPPLGRARSPRTRNPLVRTDFSHRRRRGLDSHLAGEHHHRAARPRPLARCIPGDPRRSCGTASDGRRPAPVRGADRRHPDLRHAARASSARR